ncbi:MAG: YdbL family protein [Desulfobacula sp.]|uniref:YdbL family protein n=1 Tax=Desulfobacula sp. TaxID=2593537 RepID=UPI0025C03432|nr:YdbL family protein [Desulfobacula sp.]MCD4722360.1 YdbL family protein [Desulfobacula sp.]
MNIRNIFKTHILIVLCLMITAQFVFAAGIKERMTQRLPVIVDLKAKGIVGESNKGYLAFVTDKRAQESVITDENKDRKMIYKHIAKQQNATLELVEQRRAKQIANRAKPGEFIQKPDGSWYRK